MAGPVADSAGDCWCQGSASAHQWRRKRYGDTTPYCEAARAELRARYHAWIAKPGNRASVNARRRAARVGERMERRDRPGIRVILDEDEERMA